MGRLASIVLCVLAVASAPASADVAKIYVDARAGGMYGLGLGGTQKDEAFFKNSKGGAYGIATGVQFLILDGNIKHTQFIKPGQLTTWTQFNGGLRFSLNTGTAEEKKQKLGGYVDLGLWVGFGLGTGAQVDPPLDNSEVTDKGFMAEAQFGFGKHLTKRWDIGVAVPMSWGYMFKSGAANDEDNQYTSMQIEVLLQLRANIRI